MKDEGHHAVVRVYTKVCFYPSSFILCIAALRRTGLTCKHKRILPER